MVKRFTIASVFAIHLRTISLLCGSLKFAGMYSIPPVMGTKFADQVFAIDRQGFAESALDLFFFQYKNNAIYQAYVDSLSIDPAHIQTIDKIPFLPIDFFKTHTVKTTAFEPEIIFESSGTTREMPSRHFVKNLSIYKKSFTRAFEQFYNKPDDWCIIGLLPSYLERNNSSLVFMVRELIEKSRHAKSGFYLHEYPQLADTLQELEIGKQKTLLIGVTFALLDFADQFSMRLDHTVVMETGGMKGRRKEITRTELHQQLKNKLGISAVHSEYGMTELLSQAYSKADGIFETPPWMRVLVRNEDDPFTVQPNGEGIINIIDLANIYSSAFIATEDIGKIHEDGRFEVLGRTDTSDIRGCSQLVV